MEVLKLGRKFNNNWYIRVDFNNKYIQDSHMIKFTFDGICWVNFSKKSTANIIRSTNLKLAKLEPGIL